MEVKKLANQQDPKITEGLQKASSAAMEAVKLGKAAAMIAKGAAAGGPGGAAMAALKNPKASAKIIVIAVVILLLPILMLVMLPLIIFGAIIGFVGGVLSRIGAFFRSLPIIGSIIAAIGSLFGGGGAVVYDYYEHRIYFENAFDTAHIVYNLERAYEVIDDAHYEQFQGVIATIGEEVLLIPDGEEARIIGIAGDAIKFNIASILGMYAASLYDDVMEISLSNLRNILEQANQSHDLFDFIVEVEVENRIIYPDPPPPFMEIENPETGYIETPGWIFSENVDEFVPENWVFDYGVGTYVPPPPEEITVTVHNFIVIYSGEMVFAEIFGIADDERLMIFAEEYARNLMSLLTDTDIGGWFDITREAGDVDGFYVPFPGMDWSISSPFGWRTNPFTQSGMEWHSGIDIPKPIGTPIRAIADGYIILSQFSSSAGNWIQIDHGYIPGHGYVISEYMHNSRNLVSVTTPRQRVVAGQVIAEVGSTGRSTGPHLHLGIRVNGYHVNPVSFIGAP